MSSRDSDWAIAGSQVGITMASILLGVVAEEPLRLLLSPILAQSFGQVPLLAPLSTALATLLVFLLLSFVLMVIGEQTPKTIALRYPVQSLLTVARPMTIFGRITTPLVWLVDHSTALVLKLLGVGGQTGGHGIHSLEELKQIVRESEDEGVISAGDEKLVLRAMAFGSRFVRETMIPRTDIVAVENTDTVGDLLQTFRKSRHSRFPVYEGDLDHICGIISMKEVLAHVIDDPYIADRPLTEVDVVRPALVVPESRRVGDLFNQMRRERMHMAVVIDEFGGTAGLVTSEELAKEVVGRLTDEWVSEPPEVSPWKAALTSSTARPAWMRSTRRCGRTCRPHLTTKPWPGSCFSDPPHPEAGRSHPVRQTAVHHRQDGRPQDGARAGGAGVTEAMRLCYNRHVLTILRSNVLRDECCVK